MESEVYSITTDENIPLYDQIRQMIEIVAQKCLGNKSKTRSMIMKKFEMGHATSPGEVVTVLDNFTIITRQLQVHYQTVTGMTDDMATESTPDDTIW